MKKETTPTVQYTTTGPELHMALELSEQHWKIGFGIGLGQPKRLRTIVARDRSALRQEIQLAKKAFGLAEGAAVKSCYEAGREGFWLHRYLSWVAVENLVVDPSSIEVNQRKRPKKTDRLDAEKLLGILLRHQLGEERVWSVVRVPSLEVEDLRQLHRELITLRQERTTHSNRISGLLATQGLRLRVGQGFGEKLVQLRLWDGSELGPYLQARLQREYARWQFLQKQIQGLEGERRELLRHSDDALMEQVRKLMWLKGIGVESAWVFVLEFFGWRELRNRRQVGALAGLDPTPHDSGDSSWEKGISQAGNGRVRLMAVEVAWGWLRHQPHSELTRWFERRCGSGGPRMRKIGIVALARKLLVALWRYLEYGEIPAGAALKSELVYR